ncbi:MAG TPA: DUF177 domain-containing protein [Stellaceae bacterium]|nr:DUF177 domain-containing protein [Stellaceae bacterium]
MRPPEFSRLVPLARLGGAQFGGAQFGAAPFKDEIAATPDECAALAARFGLLGLERLAARITIERRPGDTILLHATFEAAFTQECVISLEPVAGTVSDNFALCYGPPDAETDGGADEPAFEPLEGDAIDVGEAVAQEFSLSLPPFPHLPDAAVEIDEAVDDEGPFAVLRGLGQSPGSQ